MLRSKKILFVVLITALFGISQGAPKDVNLHGLTEALDVVPTSVEPIKPNVDVLVDVPISTPALELTTPSTNIDLKTDVEDDAVIDSIVEEIVAELAQSPTIDVDLKTDVDDDAVIDSIAEEIVAELAQSPTIDVDLKTDVDDDAAIGSIVEEIVAEIAQLPTTDVDLKTDVDVDDDAVMDSIAEEIVAELAQSPTTDVDLRSDVDVDDDAVIDSIVEEIVAEIAQLPTTDVDLKTDVDDDAVIDSIVEKIVDEIAQLPPIDELEAFVKRAGNQLFRIFNDLAHIIIDVNQDVDFSSSLMEKLNLAAKELKELSLTAEKFLAYGDDFISLELKFALQKIRRSGDVFVLGEDAARLSINLNALKNMATDKDIAPFDSGDSGEVAFDPDIIEIIEYTYSNQEEVKYYWKAWHDKNSRYAAENLFEVVELFQKAAKNLELPVLEFWYENYSKEFLGEMDDVMKQLKPFYLELHAYIRHQLFKKYGAGVIKSNGPIPEHLYDQVLASNWKSDDLVEDLVSNDNLPNLDNAVSYNTKYETAEKLLRKAESFYTSIGFEPFTDEFWETKIVNRTENEHDNVCTPSITDITYDVSMEYCDKVDFKTLMQDHALIGRMHFAVEKKDLPAYFFGGYNLKYPLAEAIILSASNHLEDILKSEDKDEISQYDEEMFLIRNFHMALNTMLKIPRFYIYTKIMTELLEGSIEKSELNKYYWSLMEEHAGVEPPVDREDDSLDLPYSFYTDLNQNNDVTSKFSSEILGYQFYRALCQKASYIGELHKCDFYGKKEVGKSLKEIMSLGSSKPWREVIGVLLPENSKLEATALLEYYAPIRTTIQKYISSNKLNTGWEHSKKKLTEKVYLTEEAALAFIKESDGKITQLYNKLAAEAFNRTEEHDLGENEFWDNSYSTPVAIELTEVSMEAKKFYHNKFEDKNIRKALSKLSKIADTYVLAEKVENLLTNTKALQKIATDVDIVKYQDKDEENLVALNPDILEIYKNSSDSAELIYYWNAWRNKNKILTGYLLFDMFDDFSAAAAKLDVSTVEFWFKQYSSDFLNQMEKVITDLSPLYTLLHAYIRDTLHHRYPDMTYSEPIPDHLYQQVMLQVWTNNSILESDLPFSDLPPSDKFVFDHQYNALNLLEEADKFYQSLGFDPLDEDFWKNRVSTFESKKEDCHANIYDWSPTVYMRYCEKVDFKKFMQAHGYMGRVHYAHEKRNLPSYFFNSYFLEYPVGEAVILSASSPRHLKEIGLSGDFDFTDKVQINRLIRMAVHTLFNLHMHFVRTKVVADYLSGDVPKEDIIKYYWKLMIKYAGVEPPLDRKDDDFDFPYEFYTDLEQNHQLKKFVSEVLGYQFYESLCESNEGDLHNCDFYGDKKAGALLQKMFQLGGSKSWQSTIKVLLPNNAKLSADAILRYYKPIQKWLETKNDEISAVVGFGTTSKMFYRSEDFFPE